MTNKPRFQVSVTISMLTVKVMRVKVKADPHKALKGNVTLKYAPRGVYISISAQLKCNMSDVIDQIAHFFIFLLAEIQKKMAPNTPSG